MHPVIYGAVTGAFVVCAQLLSAEASARSLPEPDGPEYKAEACCNVCPKAADRDAYVSEYMRGYRIVIEGKDGWLFRTDAELEWVEPNDPEVLQSLRRLVAALKARGSQVLLFPQPPRGLVETNKLKDETLKKFNIDELQRRYSELVNQLRSTGALVADGTAFSHNSEGQYFYKRDGHWKASGAQRAAEMIASQVAKAGFHFPAKDYETFETGVNGSRGTMSHVVSTLCGLVYPLEYGPAFQTRAPSADDLFGDESTPEVSLVGTSFSATPAYNFLGFLRDALSADVYQAAISGGGFDGALTQYLASDVYQQHPPKLIIWEFPYQQLQRANTAVMRRVIPLVGNGCRGKKLLMTSTVKLSPKNELVEAVVNGGEYYNTVPAKDLWIDFQFSDPNVTNMKAEIWFANGKSQVINTRYNPFTKMYGRFAIETSNLFDADNEPIISVRVQSVSDVPKNTTVTTNVCKLN